MAQDGSSASPVAAAIERPAGPVPAQPDPIALPAKDKELLVAADRLVSSRICAGIDAGLRATGLAADPPLYTEAARQLLRRAWTLAAQLNSREVTIDHLMVGLVNGELAAGEELGAIAGRDAGALLAGALVRIASLEVTAGPQAVETLLPSENVLRWIGEAGRLAGRRSGGAGALEPDDLVDVLRHADANPSVKRLLRRALLLAVRVGRTQSELVKARQGLESLGKTVSFFRTSTDRRLGTVADELETVSGKLQAIDQRMVSGAGPGTVQMIPSLATLDGRLDDIERCTGEIKSALLAMPGDGDRQQALVTGVPGGLPEVGAMLRRLDAYAAEVKEMQRAGLAEFDLRTRQSLGIITRLAMDRATAAAAAAPAAAGVAGGSPPVQPAQRIDLAPVTTALTGLSGTVEAFGDRLAEIDRRTAAMAGGLSLPPVMPTWWLAGAIAGVLALGILAGVALSYASGASASAEIRPAGARPSGR